MDVSPVLGPDQANYYQSLIGVLRWAIELGRIDMYIDVSLLSSHLAQPRVGHLDQYCISSATLSITLIPIWFLILTMYHVTIPIFQNSI